MAQNQTVLITGSSAGIGRETALFFHQQGWNVSATMRSPEKSTIPKDARLITPRLDVTDVKSIESAWKETEEKFGRIDAVVNNAGFGLTGPFEAANPEQIRRQFETNVFGLMTVCRTAIRAWREKNQQGNLVNVASMGGRLTVPYYSVYHSSKWAVEGFTEGLHYELAPIGIRVKLIEPGAIKTEFYDRSADNTDASAPAQYQGALKVARKNMNQAGENGTAPLAVAKAIFRAASSTSSRLRYSVGADAKMLLSLRRLIPEKIFFGLVRSQVFKGL